MTPWSEVSEVEYFTTEVLGIPSPVSTALAELFKFPERCEIASKSSYFRGVLTETMALLQSLHDVLSPFKVLGKGLLNLGKKIVPSKFGYIYSVYMNKISIPKSKLSV